MHIPTLSFKSQIDYISCKALKILGFIRCPTTINHLQRIYTPFMRTLKLCSLENRRERADQLFSLNLLHGKVNASRLLERISLCIPSVHTRSQEPFQLTNSRLVFGLNKIYFCNSYYLTLALPCC